MEENKMGFFSDLKDDLSQAVNELIPEEEEGAQVQEAEKMEEDVKEAPVAPKQDMTSELESMLEQIEEPPVVRKAPEKPAAPSFGGRTLSDEVAVITAGMKITGDVVSDGSMDVIGGVQGNIDIMGKLNVTGEIVGNSKAAEFYAENAKITGEVRSEGSIKIGQSSVIIGNIFANSAVIAGAVKGDIDVHGPVILDTTAIVMGNIKSKSVQINNGAVIEGLCSQCYADVNPTSFFEEFKKTKK